jgi:hypothetical protein
VQVEASAQKKKALDESSFKAEFMLQRGARLTSNMTRNASGLSDLTLGVSQKIKFARCVEIKASRMRGGEGVNEETCLKEISFRVPIVRIEWETFRPHPSRLKIKPNELTFPNCN